ncbi:zinc finger A20 and AN1 domain-containing stress-associated protein 4-like [Rutidosis leptorrhynchoides]|uniref:zinc finger A20 and AN1 domain-containing stress-associated protein 4-like n=1 Tax=Rutidosis leptorrhynchoides TaxID=125765 RepID=UPI003A995743
MAEEHRCQAPPEGHRLCANNCGFFGSAATMNLCSKCYRDLQQHEQTSFIKPAPATLSVFSPSPSSEVSSSSVLTLPELSTAAVTAAVEVASEMTTLSSQPNRCLVCRKRVGLTGFKCRCGTTFCGTHRYPEKHDCTFDYKKLGREEIARANPVVKGEKLEKI